jgi:hypothetical protein
VSRKFTDLFRILRCRKAQSICVINYKL